MESFNSCSDSQIESSWPYLLDALDQIAFGSESLVSVDREARTCVIRYMGDEYEISISLLVLYVQNFEKLFSRIPDIDPIRATLSRLAADAKLKNSEVMSVSDESVNLLLLKSFFDCLSYVNRGKSIKQAFFPGANLVNNLPRASRSDLGQLQPYETTMMAQRRETRRKFKKLLSVIGLLSIGVGGVGYNECVSHHSATFLDAARYAGTARQVDREDILPDWPEVPKGEIYVYYGDPSVEGPRVEEVICRVAANTDRDNDRLFCRNLHTVVGWDAIDSLSRSPFFSTPPGYNIEGRCQVFDAKQSVVGFISFVEPKDYMVCSFSE